LLFTALCEPKLEKIPLCFIYDYPASQSALAKVQGQVFDSNRSNPIATPEHCGREFCRFDKKSLSIATGVLPKTKRLLISYSKHF
jgi:hypothetical protein